MTPDPVQLVMFAIRSSVKLGQQVRQAYIDSTKRRELVLPLPNFVAAAGISAAAGYFATEGKAYLPHCPALEKLIQKRMTAGARLTTDEEDEVIRCHVEFLNLDLARAGRLGVAGTCISGDEFNALVTVRQWQRGSDPNPSVLQRLAGTFVEIGVDYFASVPGALHPGSRHAAAIQGFLGAMGEIRFAEARLGDLPGRLLVAVLETTAQHPELLAADPKIRELVQVTTRALSADVSKRLAGLGDANLVAAEAVGEWGELVFRSVLASAGELALSDPRRFLGVDKPGDAALVGAVGEAMLALVLGDDGVDMARLVSRRGLDTITRAALAAVGEHPEILRTNQAALRILLATVAGQVAQFDTVLTPDILPEVTRLILEKTGENLALFWPDLTRHPEQHLVLAAAQTTLRVLSREPTAGQRWKVRFSSADTLAVVETTVDELVANPAWVLDAAGKSSDTLETLLGTTLDVLRTRADSRLSPGTAVAIVRAVITKALARPEFLDKFPAGTAAAGRPVIAAVLDVVLAEIFRDADSRAAWQLVRSETVAALVDLTLAELARSRITPEKVVLVIKAVTDLGAAVRQGDALDLAGFAGGLRLALAA